MSGNEIITATSATLSHAYDRLSIPQLTTQQERYLLSRFRGLAPRISAQAAGIHFPRAKEFEETEHFQILLNYLHDHAAQTVGVTKERLTVMLFDAHDLAATAGERVSAIRELGQLHDLYPNKGNQVNVQINNNTNNYSNEKQIRNLSDAELLRLADSEDLSPSRNIDGNQTETN